MDQQLADKSAFMNCRRKGGVNWTSGPPKACLAAEPGPCTGRLAPPVKGNPVGRS